MMNCAFKTMNCALKTMSFVLKTMNFAGAGGSRSDLDAAVLATQLVVAESNEAREVSKE